MNIITKKGRGTPFSATVEEQVGNYGTWINRLSASGQWKILDYSIAGSYAESDGQFEPHDNSDQKALSGRIGLTLPFNSTLNASGQGQVGAFIRVGGGSFRDAFVRDQ